MGNTMIWENSNRLAPRRINSSDELIELLRAISDAVSVGKLIQVFSDNAPFAIKDDIRSIPPNGPWPDYIEAHFQDHKTGKHYKLAVETYHGSGGTWELES